MKLWCHTLTFPASFPVRGNARGACERGLLWLRGRRETDRQTDRETDRQTQRQTDTETDRHRDRQTDRQTARERARATSLIPGLFSTDFSLLIQLWLAFPCQDGIAISLSPMPSSHAAGFLFLLPLRGKETQFHKKPDLTGTCGFRKR